MAGEDFVELRTIRDIDGVVIAVITFRNRPSGERLFSYAFLREFDNHGVSKRTPWLNARHAAAVLRLTPIVVAEIAKEEAAFKKARFS